MSKLLRRAVALAILLALPYLSAGAQTTEAAAEEDPVLATVNGDEIRRSEIVEAQQNLSEQYRSLPPATIFPALLEHLIDFKLVVGEARKANLHEDDAVKKRLALLEDQLIREFYLARYVGEAITEEALRQRYDEFVKTIPPQEEIKARHILVEAEEEAQAVIARINGGDAFEDVAKETSIGPSAPEGGDLGYFTRDQMVPVFFEVAFNLKPGEMTEAPVKTGFGWHVIIVDDRRPVPPPSFEDTRGQLATDMSQEFVAELIQKLRDQAQIERPDEVSAPAAGALPQ